MMRMVMNCVCAQWCQTLCNPKVCSLPHYGHSSVHRISQARILEWVTTSFFRRTSQHRDQTHVSYVSWHWQVDSFPMGHLGGSYEITVS